MPTTTSPVPNTPIAASPDGVKFAVHSSEIRRSTPSVAPEVDAADVARWLQAGQCALIDVREPDEFARERIQGALSRPLSTFDPTSLATLGAARIVLHCRGGRRSADAHSRCDVLASTGAQVFSMRGGIEAWKNAGLPVAVDLARPRLSVMQQTQITIGTFILIGLALGLLVHPALLAITGVMGAGLIVAGVSGTCGMASLIARLPWNRASCGPTTCAAPPHSR